MAQNGRDFDPGTGAILEELRDLRVEMRDDRRRSDNRFERIFREFRDDSARRDKQIHSVGLAIVKTLNRHTRILEHNTRILERMDRKLGTRDNGRPGPNGGRGT